MLLRICVLTTMQPTFIIDWQHIKLNREPNLWSRPFMPLQVVIFKSQSDIALEPNGSVTKTNQRINIP